MKTDQEVIDSRMVIRPISGLLAASGVVVMAMRVYQVTTLDWLEIVSYIGIVWGIYLLGHIAIRGKLPSKLGKRVG